MNILSLFDPPGARHLFDPYFKTSQKHGSDFEKVMVSRVEIYPLRRVTVSHPAIYSKDCKGKSQGVKIPPQIYPLEEIFLWLPGSHKSGAILSLSLLFNFDVSVLI